MNKAKEKLNEYINKNIEKEKDKFACGSKNSYFEWQKVKAELEDRIKQSHEEQEQINFNCWTKKLWGNNNCKANCQKRY